LVLPSLFDNHPLGYRRHLIPDTMAMVVIGVFQPLSMLPSLPWGVVFVALLESVRVDFYGLF
jgi:hypothetical protein